MKKLGVLCLALAALAFAARGDGAEAADPVRSEAARIQQALDARYSHDPEWKDLVPQIQGSLTRAGKALDAGYLYRGIEELSGARVVFRLSEISQATPRASMSDFEARYRRSKVELARVDREARGRAWAGRPAVLRALAETAAGKMLALFEGSRAFAVATNPDDGLNVIAQAQADAELVGFYASLALPRPGTPLSLRSVLAELRPLQARVNDAFKPPRSIELHPQFIRLNATLKTAAELDASRLYAGSLYQYLDALQQFALLDAKAPDEAGQAHLREALASLAAEIGRAKGDDSIARLFLERAEIGLAGTGDQPPGPDDWKRAAVIVEQVLPAYRAVLAAAPASERMAAASPVTVTLVRWPFT